MTLYLSVENKGRELDSKLLLGCEMTRGGIPVVIGQQWLLNANLDRLPPGVVFFKGMNRVQVANMANAKRAGHRVVANDEEAMGVANAAYMLRDVSPDIVHVCDRVFAQGAMQADWLTAAFPELPVTVTGNPRCDLLRPEYLWIYGEEVDAIRAAYGRFVLINTNCAGLFSAWGSPQRYFEVLVNIGWLDPASAADNDLFTEHMKQDETNASAVREFATRYRDKPIVLRPHPGEADGVWDRLPVRVVRGGNHIAWLLASDILVHTGCTTGVEAQIAGHPSLSICAGDLPFRLNYLSNVIGPRTPTGLGAALALGGPAQGYWDELLPYFAALEGPFAHQRMADALLALCHPGDRKAPTGLITAMERPRYLREKMSATLSEIQGRIEALMFKGIEVEEIGDSLFVMRPSL